MVLSVIGEKTARLEDDPSALMVYMTGLEAVTFLEAVQSGYVHELTIFMPYLPAFIRATVPDLAMLWRSVMLA
jgi:hypothetical protein